MIPASFARLWVVAALTLVGGMLRLWSLGRLGLVHFDEGIYALAGLWVFSPQGLAGTRSDDDRLCTARVPVPRRSGLRCSWASATSPAILVSIIDGHADDPRGRLGGLPDVRPRGRGRGRGLRCALRAAYRVLAHGADRRLVPAVLGRWRSGRGSASWSGPVSRER